LIAIYNSSVSVTPIKDCRVHRKTSKKIVPYEP